MIIDKKLVTRYGVTFLIGLVIAFLVAFIKGVFRAVDPAATYMALCDGAFVAAVLLIGIGLMVWLGNMGTFDMMSYGFKSFAGLFSKNAENRKPEGSFFNYTQKKAEKKSPFLFIVIVGIVFLLLAFLFNGLYLSSI